MNIPVTIQTHYKYLFGGSSCWCSGLTLPSFVVRDHTCSAQVTICRVKDQTRIRSL